MLTERTQPACNSALCSLDPPPCKQIEASTSQQSGRVSVCPAAGANALCHNEALVRFRRCAWHTVLRLYFWTGGFFSLFLIQGKAGLRMLANITQLCAISHISCIQVEPRLQSMNWNSNLHCLLYMLADLKWSIINL